MKPKAMPSAIDRVNGMPTITRNAVATAARAAFF